ncbi:MAG: OB-fold nucleic acid binding domain-containing protein, partial [Bacillota bacterium]|nr:OB-fold nucleic acid binding domain-containing protein [Bacillota bacterium]
MAKIDLRMIFTHPESYGDKTISICGWVRTIRNSKTLGFLELNDGTSCQNLQVVFENSKLRNFSEIAKANVGAAMVVKGTVLLTPKAKQPLEIHADEVQIVGESSPDYPLQKKRHTLE